MEQTSSSAAAESMYTTAPDDPCSYYPIPYASELTQAGIDPYQLIPQPADLHRGLVLPYFTNDNIHPHFPMDEIPLPKNTMTAEEMQRLTAEFHASSEGPFVTPKLSTDALVTEYAQGDPVFVAKTMSLAGTHSYYRVMKGDGNCGWRAIAFSYFENLLNLRSIDKINQETLRIKSFNTMLNSVGHQEDLYEMFVDATLDLLAEISRAIQNENYDETFLLDAFNNEYGSTSIIQHFRLMTSAWLKVHRDGYQAFLPEPLDIYCANTIETVKTEIDEFGLQGLVDGVIADSGFGVEIAYLDRSQGNEVNFHLLTPDRPPSLAKIRLLYRPGHYDILYVNGPESSVNYQLGMTYGAAAWYPSDQQFKINGDLMAVPTLSVGDEDEDDEVTPSMPSPPLHHHLARPIDAYAPYHSPVALTSPGPYEHHTMQCMPTSPLSPPPNHRMEVPMQMSPLPPPPENVTELPIRMHPLPPPPDRSGELPIRMNPLVGEPMKTIPLGSMTFRNCQHNLAHYQNPDFQPSQWDYTKEYK